MTRTVRVHARTAITASLLALIGTLPAVSALTAQHAPIVPMREPPRTQESIQLVQRIRIGSLSGDADAFERIAFAALRHNREIVVADDQTHRVSVFGPDGKLKRHLGGRGQDPGEFERPWPIAALAGDSLAVWDAALARVSVFSPALTYARSFAVPPLWAVNSLRELPDGRLLINALDVATRKTLHVMSRAGKPVLSFGDVAIPPPDVAQYATSLLGGRALVLDSSIVFSHKSPFRIDVYDLRGQLVRRCEGRAHAITEPRAVISRDGASVSLQWKRFVHSTGFLRGPTAGEVWNVITDRTSGRTTLQAAEIDRCAMLRERSLPVPLFLKYACADEVVGVLESDFPEVMVYRRAGRALR